MENARKKVRTCLVIVVAIAVMVGVIYYIHDVRESPSLSGGTLVKSADSLAGERGCRS